VKLSRAEFDARGLAREAATLNGCPSEAAQETDRTQTESSDSPGRKVATLKLKLTLAGVASSPLVRSHGPIKGQAGNAANRQWCRAPPQRKTPLRAGLKVDGETLEVSGLTFQPNTQRG
jgi:hypothetical protein